MSALTRRHPLADIDTQLRAAHHTRAAHIAMIADRLIDLVHLENAVDTLLDLRAAEVAREDRAGP